MAAIAPNLTIKLNLATAGLTKGLQSAKTQLMGMAKQAGSAQKSVNGLKSTLGGVWRITGGIVLFNIIRGITHSIRDLIGTVMDFETAMYNVNSVAQLSTQELAKLNDQVLTLALDPRIKDGPAILAAGLYTVTSAGYSAQDALVLLETAAIAATAGMTTTDVAADVLISTLGAYNLTVADSAAISDKLFQIVNISKYTFEDLASSLATVTPSASNLGISIDQIGAAMATFATRGKSAETATVEMNAVLTGLLKPTEAMKDAMDHLGFASGEAMIEQLGFTKTMQVFAEVLDGDATMAAALFGDIRALRGIQTLTNDGAVLLTQNLAKMGLATEGAGATAKALEQQMKANSFQAAVLRKNIQVLAIMGFGVIAPYLNKALTGINKFFTSVLTYFRTLRDDGLGIWDALKKGFHKTLTDMFGRSTAKKIMNVVDDLERYFLVIKGMVTSLWGPVKAVFGFMLEYFNIIGPAILGAVIGLKLFAAVLAIVNVVLFITNALASPLTLTMLAFAAVGALVAVAWMNNWGDIQGKTKVAIEFIGKWLGKIWDFVQPVIDVIKLLGRYWSDIMTHKIEPGNLENIPGWLRPIALVIGRVVKSIRIFVVTWQKLGALAAFKTIPAQLRAFGRTMEKLFNAVGLEKYGAMYRAVFTDVSKIVANVIGLVDNLIHGRWGKAWDNLVQIAINSWKLLSHYIALIPAFIIDIFIMIPWTRLGKWAFKTLTLGVIWAWDNLLWPFIVSIPGLIVDVLALGFNLMYDAGNYIIAGLGAGITFGWNWLVGWFSKLAGYLDDYFANPDKILWQVGAMVVMGLWNGIVWAWNWMLNQLGALWDSLPGFAKKLWGILSPSKVFAGIGKEIPAGLAMGIESGMHSVTNAMRGLNFAVAGGPIIGSVPRSSGVLPGPASGIMSTSAFSSGGRNFNFNKDSVYINAPGGDVHEIATKLLNELERVEAGQH